MKKMLGIFSDTEHRKYAPVQEKRRLKEIIVGTKFYKEPSPENNIWMQTFSHTLIITATIWSI